VPKLLILDEPTNGLDPQGIHEIRDLLRDLNAAGTTLLLSSHLLVEVEALYSRIGIMDWGRLVLQRVLADGTRNVVVDLAGVGFMESSGLGTLVAMLKAARERGRSAVPGDDAAAGTQPAVGHVGGSGDRCLRHRARGRGQHAASRWLSGRQPGVAGDAAGQIGTAVSAAPGADSGPAAGRDRT
jgi:hypothetical protein